MDARLAVAKQNLMEEPQKRVRGGGGVVGVKGGV